VEENNKKLILSSAIRYPAEVCKKVKNDQKDKQNKYDKTHHCAETKLKKLDEYFIGA
jgi:hypothetical protein